MTTQLTADLATAHRNLFPVTDGINVAYMKTEQAGSTAFTSMARVTLWHDGVETPLSPTPGDFDLPYAVNGGWAAYTVEDGAGSRQIHTRAPDGTDRLATFSGRAYLYALGPDGTLVYWDSGGLWASRVPYTGPRRRLGAGLLSPVFRGSRLLLYLGNSVFEATY